MYDGNPKGPSSNPTNYDITLSADIITGSLLYGYDMVDVYQLTLRTDSHNQEDDNKILINPTKTFTGQNLNPHKPSVLSLSDTSRGQAKRVNSSKLEITNSPTNFINDFIISNIPDADILKSYTKPENRYSSSYADLDTFRDDFFGNYDITINTNKFIRAHENVWNQSAIEAIKKVVPARSTLSDSSIGVTIKPHLLERQKIEHKKVKVQHGETGLFSSDLTGRTSDLSKEIDVISGINLLETYETSKDGLIDINEKTSLSETNYESTKDVEIQVDDLIGETASYETTKNIEIDIDDVVVKEASHESEKNIEIDIDDVVVEQASYETTKDVDINIDGVIVEEASYDSEKTSEIDGLLNLTETMERGVTRDVEFSPLPTSTGEYIDTKNGTATYHSTHWIEDFNDLHVDWGTGINDTHFLNQSSGDSGSLGDGNIGHIDDRFTFSLIGDVEVISGSFFDSRNEFHIDYTNINNFLNREIRDSGNGYIYKSYVNGNPGNQDGRPVGKTAYFSQSADGQLLFPPNHWSKFNRPFTDRMYEGTQNINPGFLNLLETEDYSSASFYSVEVAFEHGIRVERGKLEKGSDNKLK